LNRQQSEKTIDRLGLPAGLQSDRPGRWTASLSMLVFNPNPPSLGKDFTASLSFGLLRLLVGRQRNSKLGAKTLGTKTF